MEMNSEKRLALIMHIIQSIEDGALFYIHKDRIKEIINNIFDEE